MLRTGKMQNIGPKADLVSSCSSYVSIWPLEDSFVTFHLPSLFVRRWLGESAPYRPPQGAAGFPLASAEPPGLCLRPDGAFTPRGLPHLHPGTTSGMCVCWAGPAGRGNCHRKKGKSCLLVFPASGPLPFQSLGKAWFGPAQGYVLLLPGPGPVSVRAS